MLQRSPEALAQHDAETTRQAGRGTTQQARDHGTAREIVRNTAAHVAPTSPPVQMPFSSLAKPPQVSAAPSPAARAGASNTEGSRPTGTLASLLQGSQAAEAKAYFTGLLPGKTPPPRPMFANGPKPPATSTSKAATVPTFTGFSGKLGSAANGSVKFDFSAVRVSGISLLRSLFHQT